MANTINVASPALSSVYRAKYLKDKMESALRNALIARGICQVDETGTKYIQNPYGNQPTATVQTIAGTYAVSTFTTTDDNLTVTDEIVMSEHIFAHEDVMSNFNLYETRTDEMTYSVLAAVDKYALNEILANATGAYDTPTGGFATAANVGVILSNLWGKIAGKETDYRDVFLVVEPTDLPGLMQFAAGSGFNFADKMLNNGKVTNIMGIDIYVAPASTFVDATNTTASGTKTWTNAGERMFGVKNVATYCQPHGIITEEKPVTATTGTEILVYGLVGVKLWTPRASLIVDISLK